MKNAAEVTATVNEISIRPVINGPISYSSGDEFVLGPVPVRWSLDGCSRARIDKLVGGVIYTQLCNPNGGTEADRTSTRLAKNHFYFVSGTRNLIERVQSPLHGPESRCLKN